MDCPICGLKMEEDYSATGSIVEEESYTCKNGCYVEEFAFGSTRITIFREKEFMRHYSHSKEQFNEISKGIAEEIAYWLNNDRYIMKLMEEHEMHNMNLDFKIVERIGSGYINPKGIAKIRIGDK